MKAILIILIFVSAMNTTAQQLNKRVRDQAWDATLPVPKLILPALQVNIRGGRLPEADANGVRYLRLPLDQIGKPQ